jgi:luciferase family oxidoreductase group 1
MRLSVLDQSPVRAGATTAEAFAETLALARAADRWGYQRYWVAEHHNTEGLAGAAPEVLIARIAGVTKRIRVGSGGVMLSHYSPYKVAENFRVLHTLFPNRIDLGVGRAPGSDGRTALALQAGPGAVGIDQFPHQVADVIDWLHDRLPADHPFAGVRATPAGPGAPEFWLLGSSDQSALYAAQFGCAFSFAHFISGLGAEEVLTAYKRLFRPSALEAAPRASVAVFALAADTEAEADRLALSRDLWLLRLRQGRTGPFPTPDEAAAYPYSEQELAVVRYNRRRTICGAPEQVKARLTEMARACGVDEVVIVTICHDFQARLRSYELLAQAFELPSVQEAA